MEKILVATDGSNNAIKALVKAKEMAKSSSAEITIITVVEEVTANPELTIDYSDVQEEQEKLVETGEEILKESLKNLKDFNGEVDLKVLKGNSAEMIIREIEDNDYTMVVMGSRGLGTFSRTMLGSVSHKVLNHSKVDVLIVK